MATTPRSINVDVVVKVHTVPDLPCPKCGSDEVRLSYQPPWPEGYDLVGCSLRLVEHFHHRCNRCHYDWPTADVLAARSLDVEHTTPGETGGET